jgi:hypothetical protein
VRHLLGARRLEVALVVVLEPCEERRRVDDAGVRRDGERLGDLGRAEDREIALRDAALVAARRGP